MSIQIKRIAALLLVLCLFISAFFGCRKNESEPDGGDNSDGVVATNPAETKTVAQTDTETTITDENNRYIKNLTLDDLLDILSLKGWTDEITIDSSDDRYVIVHVDSSIHSTMRISITINKQESGITVTDYGANIRVKSFRGNLTIDDIPTVHQVDEEGFFDKQY